MATQGSHALTDQAPEVSGDPARSGRLWSAVAAAGLIALPVMGFAVSRANYRDPMAALRGLIPTDPIEIFVAFLLVLALWDGPRLILGSGASRKAQIMTVAAGFVLVCLLAFSAAPTRFTYSVGSGP